MMEHKLASACTKTHLVREFLNDHELEYTSYPAIKCIRTKVWIPVYQLLTRQEREFLRQPWQV